MSNNGFFLVMMDKVYLVIPEPKPVEYDNRRLCRERYNISSGVWSIMDSPSSEISKITWNSLFEVDCWSVTSFSETGIEEKELLLLISGWSSFSGFQSLIFITLTLSSLRMLIRRTLVGSSFTNTGWWSATSSILYFSDFERSSPSTKSSNCRGLPRSSHEKEADALGSRDCHELLAPSTCWKRIGKNKEWFSILLINKFLITLATEDLNKDRWQSWIISNLNKSSLKTQKLYP